MPSNYTQNYQLHYDKWWEMQPLYKRMDKDRLMAILDPYVMQNLDGSGPTPDVINVTMNEAKVFLGRSAAIMNGANMQRIIFGKNLSDRETTTLENFYHDIYYVNDLMVANALAVSLYGFLIEQILLRGAIAARVLMREDGDKFLPDISPMDTRYFTYETDTTGLIWGAYTTTRSRAQIERDYGIVLRSRYAGVVEFWNEDVNEIYIASQFYRGGSQTTDALRFPERIDNHGLGYPPLIYMKSGAGLSSLMDFNNIQYEGESIFENNRGLIPELNRAASIFQTLTAMTFEGSYEYESEEGTEATTPKNFGGLRKIIPVEKGGGFKLIQINDVKNATRLFYNMLVGALQRGGLPNIDFGNLSFPLSAVAISKLTASKDAIFIPRLNAIALFFRAASQMIKRQDVQGGYKVEIGEEGDEREYSTSDIDKKFGTKYEFHSTSPEQDIANTAIGQQQLALGLPKHYVFEKTLRVDNPDALINEGKTEKVEDGDIAQTLYIVGHQQIEDSKTNPGSALLAEMTLQQLEMVLRDRARGGNMGLAPGRPGGRASIKPMVPLLDKQSGGGGGTPAGDESMISPEESDRRGERREEIVRKSRGEER